MNRRRAPSPRGRIGPGCSRSNSFPSDRGSGALKQHLWGSLGWRFLSAPHGVRVSPRLPLFLPPTLRLHEAPQDLAVSQRREAEASGRTFPGAYRGHGFRSRATAPPVLPMMFRVHHGPSVESGTGIVREVLEAGIRFCDTGAI